MSILSLFYQRWIAMYLPAMYLAHIFFKNRTNMMTGKYFACFGAIYSSILLQ